MAHTAAHPSPSTRRATGSTGLRVLQWAGWIAVVLLVARFWWKDAVPYFEWSEAAYGRYWRLSPWLLAHIVGGTLALLAGPFQFFSGLRRRHMGIHRWSGRIYVAGIVVGATASFYLAVNSDAAWTFGVSLFGLGLAWTVTTGMAFVAILRRRVSAHREWMARSYVVTFAFVMFRLVYDMEWVQSLGTTAEVATTVGWVSWVAPLFAWEVVQRVRKDRIFT